MDSRLSERNSLRREDNTEERGVRSEMPRDRRQDLRPERGEIAVELELPAQTLLMETRTAGQSAFRSAGNRA